MGVLVRLMKGDFIMADEEIIEVLTKRQYLTIKSNDLIQKNRFELSLPEQKTIAYICSMIKPIDLKDSIQGIPYQLEYEFNIREYCKICGIDYDNGKNYLDIKFTLKRLSDRSMWLETETGEVLCRWLSKVWINKRSGIVNIRIDEDLAPYLFNLKVKFTQYQLYNVLAMKSAFSVRIYELVKSYAYQKCKIFEINELKRLLMVDNVKSYNNFKDFRRKVLEIAQREINKMTDLNISYEPITKGRKVVKIKFIIQHKDIMERLSAEQTVNNELDKE